MNAKTQARIDRLCAMADVAANRTTPMLRVAIEEELRAQDRDTRHACAEAVVMLAGEQGELMANAAHQACLNTQAV